MALLTTAMLEEDFLGFDGLEAVVFRKNGIATPANYSVQALRREVRRETNLAGGIALKSDDTFFHLLASQIGGHTPSDGDQIFVPDAASPTETWQVLSATKQTLGIRWKIACRKARSRT
jgi:hypothetical protein